jgi:hypothetical protein
MDNKHLGTSFERIKFMSLIIHLYDSMIQLQTNFSVHFKRTMMYSPHMKLPNTELLVEFLTEKSVSVHNLQEARMTRPLNADRSGVLI